MNRFYTAQVAGAGLCLLLTACGGAGTTELASGAHGGASAGTSAVQLESCCIKKVNDTLIGKSYRSVDAAEGTTLRFQPDGLLDVTVARADGIPANSTGKWEIEAEDQVRITLDAAGKSDPRSIRLEENDLIEMPSAESAPSRQARKRYSLVQ